MIHSLTLTRVVPATALVPEQLRNSEAVGAQLRIVDGIRHIDATVYRDAVEVLALAESNAAIFGLALVSSQT